MVSLLAALEILENIKLISLFLMLRNIKYYNLYYSSLNGSVSRRGIMVCSLESGSDDD